MSNTTKLKPLDSLLQETLERQKGLKRDVICKLKKRNISPDARTTGVVTVVKAVVGRVVLTMHAYRENLGHVVLDIQYI